MSKRLVPTSDAAPRPSRVSLQTTIVLAVGALLLLAVSAAWGQDDSAPAGTATGAIAYVNAATGDEIRLVEPDGSNDRQLWAHQIADPHDIYEVWSLAWRPDATEVAFASTHENWCSTNHADIYSIASTGGGYGRVTEAPACSALAANPQGTVHVPVQNNSILGESVDAFLYMQGASSARQVSLAPGASTVVVFDEVADFGSQVQFAVEIQGAERVVLAGTGVDVQAGATVETATVYLPGGVLPGREARWPTWRADGRHIGYVFGFNSLLGIAQDPAPLAEGTPILQTAASAMPDFVDHLAWGPGSRANQLLYAAYEAFDHTGIYLATAGSNSLSEPLVAHDASTFVAFITGLAWLPDGSGFVYAVLEDEFYEPVASNIFHYDLATEQVNPVTQLDGDFAGLLSVSPDGEQIVFERGSAWSETALRVENPELWIVNRDGSDLHQLLDSGRAPAWSPQELPQPPQPDHDVYLPAILKN